MADPYYNSEVPSHVPKALLHDFNIYDYRGRDPFQSIFEMHHAGLPEIFWTRHNGGHWIILGAEAINEAGPDTERFSSARPMVPDSQNFDDPAFYPLLVDPPHHGRYRKAVAPLLLPARIMQLQGGIRELTAALAQEIRTKGSCEFMREFASVMPAIVFLRYLELPLGDRERLLEMSERTVKPEEGGHRQDPIADLRDYLGPVIRERSVEPGTDIISQLVTRDVEGGPLTFDEMMKLAISILLGGLETTASTLGFITRYLAETPEARRELIAHPELISAAVEELLRRFPPLTAGRLVTGDLEFRGVPMKARDHLNWAHAMFNLDSRKFADPMRVNFNRGQNNHMTFGVGVHFCIGHFLARQELKIFLEEWLKAIPDFRVAPGEEINYRTGMTMSLVNLPLEIVQA